MKTTEVSQREVESKIELVKDYCVLKFPETLNRVAEIASISGETLVVITPEYRTTGFCWDTAIKYIRPCPCGHFGDTYKPCICLPQQIDKHLRHIRNAYPFAMYLEYPNFPWRNYKFSQIDETALMILKNAMQEFDLLAIDVRTIIIAAKTIAGLENKTQIAAEHIAEAISYRKPM